MNPNGVAAWGSTKAPVAALSRQSYGGCSAVPTSRASSVASAAVIAAGMRVISSGWVRTYAGSAAATTPGERVTTRWPSSVSCTQIDRIALCSRKSGSTTSSM
jgi:hypothetical protein